MANRIRPLRRTGSSGVPVVANMLDGEIAVNSFDKKIYMRVGANLVEIANASSGDWNTLANKPTYANAWGSIDPATKLGTTGNWAFDGRIRATSGGKFEAYDLLGDIAVVEMGGGWANGTDGVGYVLNRRPAHPLILAGRNGAVHLDVGITAGQSTLNSELSSTGAFAGFNFLDRATPSQSWTWYSTGGIARLWFSGTGDLIWVAGDGLRAFNGLNQGQTDAGWNLRWNAIAPGVGASEYINNRQGGSGGHLFATRQNEAETPQQHHHMLSDGRMNVRTAAGGWVTQPRLFSGGGDPGGSASPGDLWFHPV